MFGDKILRKFETLCGIPEDSDEPLRIAEIRQLLLFRSSGLCPARLLLSKEDGSPLSRKQVCTAETLKWAKRKSWFDFGDFEKLKRDAVKKEEKFIGSPSYQCILSKAQQNKLKTMAMQSGGDCKAFRRQLLASTEIEAVAIHFFRWDGTPRQSVAEVEKAVCIYPSSPRSMGKFLKVFLTVAVGAVALGALGYVAHDRTVKISRDVHPTLKCQDVTIHLVGESNHKKSWGDYLRRFVGKLQQEGENPRSIIFVQSESPKEIITDTFADDHLPAFEYWPDKYFQSPIMFFNMLLRRPDLRYASNIQDHRIVPYDVRDMGLYWELLSYKQESAEYNTEWGFSDVLKLSINQRSRMQYANSSNHRDSTNFLMDRQLKCLRTLLTTTGEGRNAMEHLAHGIHKKLSQHTKHHKPSLLKFVTQVSKQFSDFKARFGQVSLDEASVLLNGMLQTWGEIADYSLVYTIKCRLPAMRYDGIRDVYVFLEDDRIPNTKTLLQEVLGCM